MKTNTQDGRHPIPPLFPTRDKNWKMCKTPLHQENFIESLLAMIAGADRVS